MIDSLCKKRDKKRKLCIVYVYGQRKSVKHKDNLRRERKKEGRETERQRDTGRDRDRETGIYRQRQRKKIEKGK